MRARGGPVPVVEFEVVGVAVGAALVSGALSVLGPYLASLTGALAALAFAGWIAGRSSTGPGLGPALREPGALLALASLAAGAAVYLGLAAPFARWRGLVLGVALVPLWWSGARRPR
jgi:hypothetical protein